MTKQSLNIFKNIDMKILFISLCCALCMAANAQSTVTKTYPVQAGQQVVLRFDYPQVKISTWDKNEVSVIAHVDIEYHGYDSLFTLQSEQEKGVLGVNDA